MYKKSKKAPVMKKAAKGYKKPAKKAVKKAPARRRMGY